MLYKVGQQVRNYFSQIKTKCMRHINIILLLLVLPAWAFAQTTIIDFEGTPPTFNDFNGSMTQVIDNPDASGINTSSKVAENVVPAETSFAGVFIPEQSVSLADGKTFTMQVWSPMTDLPVLLKFEEGDGDNVERVATFTGDPGEWQELTFDFSDVDDFTYAAITVFMNFNVVADEEMTFYWDNVQQMTSMPPSDEPATSAPTPEEDPEFVVSMFSDAYDDVPVDTWLTTWSAAGLEDIDIQGNATKKYTGLDFAGIETTGDNAIDLEGNEMTHLHVDMWSPNSTTFRIKLVDFGGDGFGNDNDTEFELIFEEFAQGEWVSLDIPLMDFEGMNQSDVSQFIISSLPAGTSTVYMDNVYYYNADPNSTNTPQSGLLEAFPNPAASQFTIRAPQQMEQLRLYDATGRTVGQWMPDATQFELNTAELKPGMYVAVAVSGQQRWVVKLMKE